MLGILLHDSLYRTGKIMFFETYLVTLCTNNLILRKATKCAPYGQFRVYVTPSLAVDSSVILSINIEPFPLYGISIFVMCIARAIFVQRSANIGSS